MVKVTMRELNNVWAECRTRNILFNGMTSLFLSLRYGGNVEHRMGVGWFKDPTVRPLTYAETFTKWDGTLWPGAPIKLVR